MRANDRLRDLRILVVDDDKDTRQMLRFILQQAGGHAVAVGSVAEALENYKSSPPDVIVSDIGMPDYNGYALIALVGVHDKEFGRTTPVIALTSFTSPADKRHCTGSRLSDIHIKAVRSGRDHRRDLPDHLR